MTRKPAKAKGTRAGKAKLPQPIGPGWLAVDSATYALERAVCEAAEKWYEAEVNDTRSTMNLCNAIYVMQSAHKKASRK
jgi:hypothetical protein